MIYIHAVHIKCLKFHKIRICPLFIATTKDIVSWSNRNVNNFLYAIFSLRFTDIKIIIIIVKRLFPFISQVIAAGKEKLAGIPTGGVASSSGGGAAAAGGGEEAAKEEEKKEEKKEESEESDDDMGFGLFD